MIDNSTILLSLDELNAKSVVDYIDNLADDIQFRWDSIGYCGYLYCKDGQQACDVYDEIATLMSTVDWLNDIYSRQE